MPPVPVAVEIVNAPDETPRRAPRSAEAPGLRDTLLMACTDAARAACVSAESGGEALVTARVVWDGPTRASVDAGLQSAPVERWSARRLQFSASDPAAERWRAVGYATGLLAGDLLASSSRERAADVPTDSSEKNTDERPGETAGPTEESIERAPGAIQPAPLAADEEPVADRAAASATVPERGWFATGAFFAGPALDRGPWKLGGVLRLGRDLGGPFLTSAIGYANRARDDRGLMARWITPALGGGLNLTLDHRVGLDVRGELLGELLTASVEDPETGRADDESRFVGGIRTGLDLFWRVTDPIGFTVGAEVTLRPASTDVIIEDERFATARAVDYAGLVGAVAYFY